MPYIGRTPTNSGQFALMDEISQSFDGSQTEFTCSVGATEQQPDAANVLITLGGVLQHANEAYTMSGSRIVFSEAPDANTKFYGIITGESQFIRTNSIENIHIADSAQISSSKLSYFTDINSPYASTASFGRLTLNDSGSSLDFVGDVSGSLISTGSFGSVNATHLNGILEGTLGPVANALISGSTVENAPSISGSLTSTGSFGTVKIVGSGSSIEAIGDVSSSLISTASFGSVNATHLNGVFEGTLGAVANDLISGSTVVNAPNISGSITSTGSFGSLVVVDKVQGNLTLGGNLLASGDLDIGAHGFRSNTLTADNQTSGRVAIYGTNGLLSEDSDLTFSGATLTATNLSATTITATGDISTSGSIFAREFHTEFTSASVVFASGSNKFGDDSGDTHRVTGSLLVSGSITMGDGDLTVTDNLDVDGTTNLDVVDIDGNVDIAPTASIGRVLVDGNESTNASPGLAFDNDTDTGIVWGGNNALVIATGGTRRVEFKADYEVSIDGGGNNASTVANAYADNLVIRGSNDGNGSGITIFSETDEFGTLYFGDGASGDAAYRGYVQYSHAADTLQLGAAGAGKIILGANSRISLSNNDNGSYNTIFGDSAGEAILSGGNYNTVFGYQAGAAVTTGDQNTLFGAHTGDALVGGSYNVAMGVNTMGAMTTGQENVAIGNSAMALNKTGLYNTVVGQEAMYAAAGSHADNGEDANVAIGYKAMQNVNAGSNQNALVRGNVAIGYLALQGGSFGSSDLNLDYNIAIGINALNSTGTTEHNNTVAIGRDAGTAINNTDASGTTLVGSIAGASITRGRYNTAIGYSALYSNTEGDKITVLGYEAAEDYNPTADYGNSVFIGYQAGKEATTARKATIVGDLACAIGIMTGHENTFFGHAAGYNDSSGHDNTLLGSEAGDTLTTGANNTIIGSGADSEGTGTNRAVGIGRDITAVEDFTTVGDGTDDIRAAHGTATWNTVSDKRFKKNIETSTAGLSFIEDLRPVTYNWKNKGEIPNWSRAYQEGSEEQYRNSKNNHGFIAQEVKEAIDNHPEIKDGFSMWYELEGSGGQQEVGEAALIPVLVKAVQELSQKNEALEKRIEELEN